MGDLQKLFFAAGLVFLVGLVSLNFYSNSVSSTSDSVFKTSTGFITSVGPQSSLALSGTIGLFDSSSVKCWDLTTEAACQTSANSTCVWHTDSGGSFCERPTCFKADDTNKSYCEDTLKEQFNLSCSYGVYSADWCDPNGTDGIDYFGDSCSDFNDASSCYQPGFCDWNGSACTDPVGFNDNFIGSANPSCSVLNDQAGCLNVTGCTWSGTACSGNTGGISCSNLNKTICSDFTLLSTCCTFNGTSCKVSFENGCYDSVGALPIGATFCEDFNVFKNQTLCNQISGTPWYMPCNFNASGNDECHFNSAGFGGASSFDEMGTQKGCEAQNGIWKTEQYLSGEFTKTDSWCEFGFGFEVGGGGNCDTACWACETGVSVTKGNNTAQANAQCQNSNLGYCQFTEDSSAQNGLGYCNPKQEFIAGGGKNCNDECSACDYLLNPDLQCGNSSNGCKWVADTAAPNGAGFCYGKSEKYCGNDCWSCYDSSECATTGDGGAGACTWDVVTNFCKPAGFTGEICFDAKDNDNDGNIDCADSDCSTNKFCGGADLGVSFGKDCVSIANNDTCTADGCVWVIDHFDANFGGGAGSGAGHCDFPGSQCFEEDENETACNDIVGCSYLNSSSSFCHENSTIFDTCFGSLNESACTAGGCGWTTDPFNSAVGRCEPLVFSECFGNVTRHINQTNCEENATVGSTSTKICSWTTNQYSPNGGFCEAVCFGSSGTAAACETASSGLCQLQNGLCEPDSFGGKCFQADGNQTGCEGNFTTTCSWTADTNANNNQSPSEASGWCNPKNAFGFINFLGDVEPIIIGVDENESSINDSWDITSLGLRDEFDKVVFGTKLYENFTMSATCNATPTYNDKSLGFGNLNFTFYWYLDADGNNSNSCSARDNSSVAGFEFSFKYQGYWDTALKELKSSYQCVNGSWGAVPIPLTSNKAKMCDLVGGGMAGIDKKELFKFKSKFNKSADLRIYATVGNDTTNESIIQDFTGPHFYSPGTVDFKFEDCSDASADLDGDGLKSSNDPDCFNYLKFGYVPIESGFQCGDKVDNDGDGNTDCDDDGCSYSFECGGTGTPVVNANDKTAPKVVWQKCDAFPDAAICMFDTNEPSNGTFTFYNTDATCKTVNKTIRDIGLVDTFVPTFKLWHDAPVDNNSFNSEALVSGLNNATAFFYKTTVCDINGNCAVSACSNFTTKTILADCKSCKTTLNFPWIASSGTAITDPEGNLSVTVITQNGTVKTIHGNAEAGTQLDYTQTKDFDLIIENPSVANDSKWKIVLVNASISGKLSTGAKNFSAKGGDLNISATGGGNASFVGLGTKKCQELINAFRPKKLLLGIPGNVSELWQCSEGLANCTEKTSNATLIGYNISANMTEWYVPAEWGC